MMLLLYECVLWLFALVALPRMLYLMWTTGKYKKSFLSKLGANFPFIDKQGRPLIWIHAVSVGETRAVAALAKKLKNSPEKPLVLISSSTETGHADAKKCMPFADYFVFLPFDFFWTINRVVRKVKPDTVILCETDWWLNFLRASKKEKAKIFVVNAKISERSKERFKKLAFFSKRLFGLVDLFCVQSSHYLSRFGELEIPKSKLLVTGNIKFDDEHHRLPQEELDEFRDRLGLALEAPCVVIGSSHAPEEKELLKALQEVKKQAASLKIVVVPRHPERFDEVADLVISMGFSLRRYSSKNSSKDEDVVLVDAMGLLRKCYQIATVAVVAGSFTSRVGGHNILEPMYYGVPTVFGPHMHSQPELLELVLGYDAGMQVSCAAEAAAAVASFLSDQTMRARFVEAGSRLVSESQGATQHTYEAIEQIINKKTH
jgi:3-deoxy-D-manno-octulosonic-acid transferase